MDFTSRLHDAVQADRPDLVTSVLQEQTISGLDWTVTDPDTQRYPMQAFLDSIYLGYEDCALALLPKIGKSEGFIGWVAQFLRVRVVEQMIQLKWGNEGRLNDALRDICPIPDGESDQALIARYRIIQLLLRAGASLAVVPIGPLLMLFSGDVIGLWWEIYRRGSGYWHTVPQLPTERLHPLDRSIPAALQTAVGSNLTTYLARAL